MTAPVGRDDLAIPGSDLECPALPGARIATLTSQRIAGAGDL